MVRRRARGLGSLFRIASLASFAMAQSNLKARIRTAVRQGILVAVALVFILSAFGFGLIAAFLWLAREVNPIMAALILMGVLLATGLILLGIASRPAKRKSPLDNPIDSASEAVQSGLDQLTKSAKKSSSIVKNPVVQLAVVAALIGYVIGRR